MNRQTRRMLQRQGQVGPDGQPVADARRKQDKTQTVAKKAASAPRRERKGTVAFLRDVRGELRRVVWPSRNEVANYTAVVLVTLVVLIALIFVLDFAFARSILFLFERPS